MDDRLCNSATTTNGGGGGDGKSKALSRTAGGGGGGSGSDGGGNGGGVGGFVETSKAEKAVWLMKCPPVVSRVLRPPSSSPAADSSSPPSLSYAPSQQSPLDSSRPVAKVVLSVDPLRSNDDDSSPQFMMELAGNEAGGAPKCYTMNMFTDFIPMSVFSESSQGRISVEGKIMNKFDMNPHNDDIESYGKLCRARANRSTAKTRQIQIIGDDHGERLRPLPGTVGSASGFGEKKKLLTKGAEVKRIRKDRQEMEDIMFKLFEKQHNWSLRQLIQKTNQPEQFLKDVLKDLCLYNNKGAAQGTYELKPEYRKSREEPSKPAT